MSCSPFDLRDYFLKELRDTERRAVEDHLRGCTGCREEVDRLRLSEAALLSLRDEEIPRRIAFVSDPVFETSGWRKWWSELFASPARLGFASAAMLSVALVTAAFVHSGRTPVAQPVVSTAQVDTAAVQREIDRRVTAAVQAAVAETDARNERRTAELLATMEKRNESNRQAVMLAVDENLQILRKRFNNYMMASSEIGPPRREEGAVR